MNFHKRHIPAPLALVIAYLLLALVCWGLLAGCSSSHSKPPIRFIVIERQDGAWVSERMDNLKSVRLYEKADADAKPKALMLWDAN